MRCRRYFHDNFTSPYINKFISRVFKSLFMTIRTPFLNEKIDFIQCLQSLLFPALVTGRCYNFTFTFTFWTICLILLNKTWSESLCFYNMAFAITPWAIFDVFGLICARPSTIGTECASRIFDFHITAVINIFK